MNMGRFAPAVLSLGLATFWILTTAAISQTDKRVDEAPQAQDPTSAPATTAETGKSEGKAATADFDPVQYKFPAPVTITVTEELAPGTVLPFKVRSATLNSGFRVSIERTLPQVGDQLPIARTHQAQSLPNPMPLA